MWSTAVIEQRQHEPLINLLRKLGGWPVLDASWNATAFDLEVLLAKLRLYSNRVLINVWVGADDKNSEVNIIMVGQMIVLSSDVAVRRELSPAFVELSLQER